MDNAVSEQQPKNPSRHFDELNLKTTLGYMNQSEKRIEAEQAVLTQSEIQAKRSSQHAQESTAILAGLKQQGAELKLREAALHMDASDAKQQTGSGSDKENPLKRLFSRVLRRGGNVYPTSSESLQSLQDQIRENELAQKIEPIIPQIRDYLTKQTQDFGVSFGDLYSLSQEIEDKSGTGKSNNLAYVDKIFSDFLAKEENLEQRTRLQTKLDERLKTVLQQEINQRFTEKFGHFHDALTKAKTPEESAKIICETYPKFGSLFNQMKKEANGAPWDQNQREYMARVLSGELFGASQHKTRLASRPEQALPLAEQFLKFI